MANTPDDAELERLLRQLLRVVIPAGGDAPAREGPARDRITSAVGRSANGAAAGASATGAAAATAAAGAAAAGAAAASVSGSGGIPPVSSSEARALIELVTARGIAQGELAGLLGLEKSTVSRLAAGLERKGWIRRGRDEGNQRYVRLYLTAEGGVMATRVWNAWHSRQARILAGLSAEERAGLVSGLRGLVRGLAAEGLLGDVLPAARASAEAPSGD